MPDSTKTISEINETARVEAFSDGVFAIAITLLILDIKVPHGTEVPLARALTSQWPSYAALLVSFTTISIMWINHHRLFTLIRRCDHLLMLLNAFLLLCVTIVPFPTALVAEHLGEPNEKLAVLVYSGTFVVTAVAFNVLWRYAANEGRLLGMDYDRTEVAAQTKQYAFGPVFYLVAFVTAFFNAPVSLLISFGLALFFALPPRAVASV